MEGLAQVDRRTAGRSAAASRSDADGVHGDGLGVAAIVSVSVFHPGFPSAPKGGLDADTRCSADPDVGPASYRRRGASGSITDAEKRGAKRAKVREGTADLPKRHAGGAVEQGIGSYEPTVAKAERAVPGLLDRAVLRVSAEVGAASVEADARY